MRSSFSESLSQLVEVAMRSKEIVDGVDEAGQRILSSLQKGKKILSCGNGGSAADAMHLTEELVGKFCRKRRALPGICLNADATILTCVANDFGYSEIFARGLEAYGVEGDLLVAFSTSGNSPNVVKALQSAKAMGIDSVLVSGGNGGEGKQYADVAILVPSQDTARIQEIHTVILHSWLETIDSEFH